MGLVTIGLGWWRLTAEEWNVVPNRKKGGSYYYEWEVRKDSEVQKCLLTKEGGREKGN